MRRPSRARRDGIVGNVEDRLRHWREIHASPSVTVTTDEVVSMLGVPQSMIALWVRAGAPFTQEGDFESADGFVFIPAHLLEWLGLIEGAVLRAGAHDLHCQLGFAAWAA